MHIYLQKYGEREPLSNELEVLVLSELDKVSDVVDNTEVQQVLTVWGEQEEKTASRRVLFLAERPLFLIDSKPYADFGPDEGWKTALAQALDYAEQAGYNNVCLLLDRLVGELGRHYVDLAVDAITLHVHRVGKPEVGSSLKVSIMVADDSSEEQAAFDYALARATAVNLSRDLVGLPGSALSPQALIDALQACSAPGVTVEVFNQERLKSWGSAGLLHVGKGSSYEPYLGAWTYTPEGWQPGQTHLCLIGKGITFDSGGYNLKTGPSIATMHCDMGGAGALIGAASFFCQYAPTIKVTILIPTAENMISGDAYRPGDIITYKNGVSVHVGNSDAEGRLVLADALIYAGEQEATHIIDLATLTGSAIRAIGKSFIALMGNNRELEMGILKAGGARGENFWKFPLPAEYKSKLKHDIADISNVGGPEAGLITAGLFLERFVPEGSKWAHLDLTGAWRDKSWKYYRPGAIGTGTKSIIELVVNWSLYLDQAGS